MNPASGSIIPSGSSSRAAKFWPPLLIALAGASVYANSFSGPFVYDDLGGIAKNPTLRHLWPFGPVLSPPAGLSVSGRPFLNLSLAINYAISGTQVWSYHAVNLLIHILAGLVLYGVVRRTLEKVGAARPCHLAFAIALLWTVHPLQTEAVTYVIQRSESLMGLFYLLTFYCFIRGAEEQGAGERTGDASWLWFGLSGLACLFGAATKEVIVSAPVVILLYDRTFLAGSFREAWRRRRTAYLTLATSWVLLACLVAGGGGNRGGSMGIGLDGPWYADGLTQFQAICHYLRLAVWPHPLVFEYGVLGVRDAGQVLPYACVIVLLAAAATMALWRWPAWGFLGFCFFAILAPTSLLSTATQVIVEHRMYLALAPVLAALACGGDALMRRGGGAGVWLALLLVLSGICAALTVSRNGDYRTAVALWADTVAKRPGNAVAHNSLGAVLEQMPGRWPEAVVQYQAAIRLQPGYAEAHYNLGKAWSQAPERRAEAIAQFEAAIRLKPDFPEAHNNLGNLLLASPGRRNDAIVQYQAALCLNPGLAEAHNNLGNALAGLPGRGNEAIAQYQEALRLQPDYAEAHFNLAVGLLHFPDRLAEAQAHLETFLRLRPGNDTARQLLAQLQAITSSREPPSR